MTPRQILDALIAGAPEEEVRSPSPRARTSSRWPRSSTRPACARAPRPSAPCATRSCSRQLGVPGETFEGYLYPDTYQFKPGTPAAGSSRRWSSAARRCSRELQGAHKPGVAAAARSLRLRRPAGRPHGLARREGDRARRGAAAHRRRLPQPAPPADVQAAPPADRSDHRLRLHRAVDEVGRLQAVRGAHPPHPPRRQATTRTTRTRTRGCRPGPISQPRARRARGGDAARRPPYLYFVSKNDGTHYFSKTAPSTRPPSTSTSAASRRAARSRVPDSSTSRRGRFENSRGPPLHSAGMTSMH